MTPERSKGSQLPILPSPGSRLREPRNIQAEEIYRDLEAGTRPVPGQVKSFTCWRKELGYNHPTKANFSNQNSMLEGGAVVTD